MIEIANIQQVRDCEQYTMVSEPIASIDLMERAGAQFVKRFLQDSSLPSFNSVFIFAGPGNNGGDGLVIARLLSKKFKVTVIECGDDGHHTPDYLKNRDRLSSCSVTLQSLDEWNYAALPKRSILIDALFGIGLSRPLSAKYEKIIDLINSTLFPVIAVDVPSGLYCDKHTPEENLCVHADKTYTFQFLKSAYLLPENDLRVGEIELIDIQLKKPENIDFEYFTTDLSAAQKILKRPSKYAHKGSNGHGLLIAGSRKMPGAALLASEAAMRSGIGKVTLHAPESVLNALTIRVPEALHFPDHNSDYFSEYCIEEATNKQALAVGSGIGTEPKTVEALKTLIFNNSLPLILDADALNILSQNKEWLDHLPKNSILTPHFKEFEKLTEKAENDFDRIAKLKAFAIRYQVIVILKGAHSAIGFPNGKTAFNLSGNPGLATAGTGDVLTGILLGLSAQHYTPEEAALFGTFLHGFAADCAMEEQYTFQSLIASDVIKYIRKAFYTIENKTC